MKLTCPSLSLVKSEKWDERKTGQKRIGHSKNRTTGQFTMERQMGMENGPKESLSFILLSLFFCFTNL